MVIGNDIVDAIERFEAEIFRLRDYGLPEFGSAGYWKAYIALKEVRAEKSEKEREVWREIDKTLLTPLMEAYRCGSETERQHVRDLLKRHSTFAWGLGWAGRDGLPLAKQAPSVPQLRQQLALFAMKDGVRDPRDEVVALDELSKAAARSNIDIVPLFREAAEIASDHPRGGRDSTRATLVDRVVKLLGS
jgi:hypothetical protein